MSQTTSTSSWLSKLLTVPTWPSPPSCFPHFQSGPRTTREPMPSICVSTFTSVHARTPDHIHIPQGPGTDRRLTFDLRAPPMACGTLINALFAEPRVFIIIDARVIRITVFNKYHPTSMHAAFFPISQPRTEHARRYQRLQTHRDSYGNSLNSMEGQAGNLWRRCSRGGTCWGVGHAATFCFCWR